MSEARGDSIGGRLSITGFFILGSFGAVCEVVEESVMACVVLFSVCGFWDETRCASGLAAAGLTSAVEFCEAVLWESFEPVVVVSGVTRGFLLGGVVG